MNQLLRAYAIIFLSFSPALFYVLFSAGEGPFPGIVDMYTFGGGLSEVRASLLANKGYIVLALAYYGYQDLPKNPKTLNLEYFEEAVNYLRGHPEVSIKEHLYSYF